MTNEKKIKIGIIGIGNMGSIHVDHVIDLNNTELAAVCDIDEEKLQAVTDKIEVPAFASYQDMLNSVELDGIVIATPHYSHPDITLAAFAKGINVLVEKPIAVHVNDAQRMIDGYNEARKTHPNLIFEAMFMQRTYGHWRKIKEMIDSGELGQLFVPHGLLLIGFVHNIIMIVVIGVQHGDKKGGGVLMNQCPHNLDLYQWLVGMPKHVHGFVTFGKHHIHRSRR